MNWFFARRRIYRDLSEEIQQHIAEKIETLVTGGMSRQDAEHAAKRAFGNVTRMEERGREAWMWPRIEGIFTDARFAVRRLVRSPGFAVTAILTLAFGIGANVVVFSLLNGIVLRPLDIPHPENFFQITRGHGSDPEGEFAQSYPDYLDFRDRDSSFSGMLASQTIRAGLNVGKSAVRSWGSAVSGNYFDVLGLRPALGHFFHSADEHGAGSAPYVVISYDFWRRQFSSNPKALGQTVELNKHPFTIVGVAPEGFHGTDWMFWPDYWFPAVNAAQVTGLDDLCCRDHIGFEIFGRLTPGITPQQATASLNALAAQMAKEDPKDNGLRAGLIQPGPGGNKSDPTREALLGIMLLALLVLLAACANLASIFAARAADRSSELSIRLAIGASRWIVLRQLLIEAVTVSIAGGLTGSFFATLLLGALSQWQPFGDYPIHFSIAPDARVYAVALALSIASGLFFGLLPARQVLRTDVMGAIKSGYSRTESYRGFALRDLLLFIQIVVCVVLVTASLVSLRGMMRALKMPLGFQPKDVLLAQTDLRMAGYSGAQAFPVQKRMLEAAAGIPGVTSAAVADSIPFREEGEWFVYRQGTAEYLPAKMVFASPTFLISPGYLRTTGTQLLSGRDFTWRDDSKSPYVAIVNRTFARRLFGAVPAVGNHFALWDTAQYEVVGVVEDGKYGRIGEEPQPVMFLPLAQGVGGVISGSTQVIVRSRLPIDQLTAALRRVLSGVEPNIPFTVQLWTDVVDLSMAPARAAAVVLAIMGFLAALLAVTGIFGMASYSVSKRMREQGIRMALGAQHFQVMRSMLGRPLLLLLGGSGVGLAIGLLTTRLLAHLVSFATPHDPAILVGVIATMTLLGLLATWIPARRALAINPAQLLREQ